MLCCVPNCKTNATSNHNAPKSCFKLPTNKSLKEEWLRNIPVTTFNKQRTGVCISHFEERFIKRSNENPLKGRLVNGAVPTVFSKDESSNEPVVQPDVITEHVVIELDANAIESFDTLKSDLESVLQLDDWKVAYSDTSLHIYKLMVESNGNLRIETSISIDSDLVLKIFHLDKALGMKFSKHTVHRSLKLRGWSHLQRLLDKFNNVQEIKVHSEKVRYE